VRVLRTAFAGIGQLLLATDRSKADEPESDHGPSAADEHQDPLRTPARTQTAAQARRSGDEAGPAAAGAVAGPAAGPATAGAHGQRRKSGKTPRATGTPKTPDTPKASKATRIGGTGRAAAERVKAPARPGKPAKGAGKKGSGKRKSTDQAGEQSRWRSLDSTGNVRLLTPAEIAESKAAGQASATAAPQPADLVEPQAPAPKTSATQKPPTPQKAPVAQKASVAQKAPTARKALAAQRTPAPRKPLVAQKPPVAQQAPAAQRARTASEAAQVPAASLPLPGYDGLSLASLRARLRNLDADQLRALIDYEKSNAGREDVITMFERRITRISGEG